MVGFLRRRTARTASSADDAVRRRALDTTLLLADEPGWVHRRVEGIEFIDSDRFRRSMSVDFTIPDWLEPQGGAYVVPLAIPFKRLLRDFDARDDQGCSLPILTRNENSDIAAALLTTQAEEVLAEQGSEGIHRRVARQLGDVAGARRSTDDWPSEHRRATRRDAALAWFRAAIPNTSGGPERQRAILWADATMQAQIRQFADRFILFALVSASDKHRRIVKISYEEVASVGGVTASSGESFAARLRESLAVGLGWKRLVLEITVRAIYGAESYHAEALVPDELIIRSARLGRAIAVRDPRTNAIAVTQVVLATDHDVDRAHLYQSGSPPRMTRNTSAAEVTEVGFIQLSLCLKPGVIIPPMISACVSATILWGGLAVHWSGLHRTSDTAAVVLVALPAFAAPYLIPGEHRLVRKMFRMLRATVVLSAAASFVAAVTLATDLSENLRTDFWLALALGTTVLAAITGVAAFRAWSRDSAPSDAPV